MLLHTLLHKRRNRVIYFRWRCPEKVRQIVGKWELVRSLNTQNPRIANVRAVPYYKAVLTIQRVLAVNRLTEDQISEIIRSVWAKLDKVLKQPITYDEMDVELLAVGGDITDWIDSLYEETHAIREGFDPREDRFDGSYRNWPELLTMYGINPEDYLEDDRERLYQELLRLRFDFFLRKARKVEKFRDEPVLPSSKITDQKSSTILFSELYKRFIDHKKKNKDLSDGMQKEYKLYYETFIDLEGDFPLCLRVGSTCIASSLCSSRRGVPKGCILKGSTQRSV